MTRSSEFQRVRNEGKTWRGGLFTLAVVDDPDPEAKMRAGIITSRRVGTAVERNRVRRRLREILRRHQHEIRSGTWIVVIASARAARASYAELEHEWLRLAGPALS